jgi:hypothetical protein
MTILLALAFLVQSAASIKAQDPSASTTQSTPTAIASTSVGPISAPAATYSQAYCAGFISESTVPRNITVVGGSDDDFHSVIRQSVKGESVYLAVHNGSNLAVGTVFSVVRPADNIFQTIRYQGENWEIRKLGTPYSDVAQVTITHATPKSVVAKVSFSCEAVVPGDILVPFQPRIIPEYTTSTRLDSFAPPEQGKRHGHITASNNNFGYIGRGDVIYLNLGNEKGVQAGARFRIFNIVDAPASSAPAHDATPPEAIGEAVVLSVRPKSCVAIIVGSYREISAGNYVEEE